MEGFRHKPLPPDLADVVARLRAGRPGASASELERIRSQVKDRAFQGTGAGVRWPWFRTRLALSMALTLGVLMCGTGVTVAVTGAVDDQSPDAAQYREEGDQGGVLGGQEGSGDRSRGGQAAEQQAAVGDGGDGDGLPFTGLAAIPLLLVGVALLTAGTVLRRRAGP